VLNTDKRVKISNSRNTEDQRIILNPLNIELKFSNKILNGYCKVRNPPKEKLSDSYYFISKNQIDDIKDRQVDLDKKFKLNADLKLERSKHKQGLLLIYPLDSRSAGLDCSVPIVGYSLHFPRIENEVKVSYRTTIFNDFDQDVKEDDDQE
jgi:hypothetical protein